MSKLDGYHKYGDGGLGWGWINLISILSYIFKIILVLLKKLNGWDEVGRVCEFLIFVLSCLFINLFIYFENF